MIRRPALHGALKRANVHGHFHHLMPSHLIYGKQAVMELLRAGRRKVESILYVESSSQKLQSVLSLATKMSIPLKQTSVKQLDDRTAGAVHQSVAAICGPPAIHDLDSFISRVTADNKKTVVVIMDSIMDPRNFGAILRSAETFGVAGAIFPKDRSSDINSTVVKTAAGATEYLEFCRVTNIASTVRQLRDEGFYVVAADQDGKTDVNSFSAGFPLAVVLGSEEKGVRPLVKKNCDETIQIPLYGKVSSLNVSSAAAVIFYEISKQY